MVFAIGSNSSLLVLNLVQLASDTLTLYSASLLTGQESV